MIGFTTNSGSTERASRRAALVTFAFAGSGVLLAWWNVTSWPTAAPLAVFYAALVVNTYFSVRCFSVAAPSAGWTQQGLDAALAVIYLALAASIGQPERFATVAVVLYAVTLVKYEALIRRGSAVPLLLRKLRVNSLGILACALALAAMMAGLRREASWFLAAVLVSADVYLLWLRPLYVADNRGHSSQ